MNKSSPLYEQIGQGDSVLPRVQNSSMHLSVIFSRKVNKGIFCLLFSPCFAGFRKELSAENLPFRREGMAELSPFDQ